MGIILAILLFSAIVIFHELGHFLLAKKNKIHRVYSLIDPKNKASIKTAQYSGMVQCGHTHHSSKVRGKWADDVIMEKILKSTTPRLKT